MNKILLLLISLFSLCFAVKAQELYVGTNYHPHDAKDVAKYKHDIGLMKDAGFKVVRMGHLAWDSYEPFEGKFDFKWFDTVMNMMDDAGIKVILDIAVRPAPIWLHHKFPSISNTDPSGNLIYPNHRYAEDIGDANYQKYALRYADTLTKHFGKHPALLAFGIDNEPGDGQISYSETARKRFIAWLQKKYKTTDNLNKAWASQRWSRRINQFDEVGFPVSGNITGAPERVLDFRLFVSDEVNGMLVKLCDKVKANAPNALTTTNMWYYSGMKYFDYSKTAYTGKITRGGNGFYPGNSLNTSWGLLHALFGIQRIQFENTTPFWCTEFTTFTATPGSMRKSAYASLMYGNQMVCGWTWQTMYGGEEQFTEGMTDWDGIPNRKYDEYKKIATEFKKIEKFFPYKPNPEIGLAFSFSSQIASSSFPELHDDQLQNCFSSFYFRNMDTKVVEISRSNTLSNYKLLIVPGVAVMDEATASKLREYINNGGTVIMTSNSAVVDEHSQVFTSTRPGRLSDVFGIRIASFEEPEALNEVGRDTLKGKKIRLEYKGKKIESQSSRFDVIEPKGAQVLGSITSLDKDYPIITSNNYGKGRAIYIGLPAKGEVMNPIIDELITALSIKKGPDVPQNVLARQIDGNHFLYMNTSGETKEIEVKGSLRSILHDKDYTDKFTIAPYEPEFIEVR
ncbi:beta-galactosidase [Parasediminibacterium sp. JCM 36343]|uniref:beta-galactosidase n=1 Tax=Parasediminibacterium sp. JCM 36343 TaxID=3374279 RepID=UPI00397C25B6